MRKFHALLREKKKNAGATEIRCGTRERLTFLCLAGRGGGERARSE